MEQHDIDAGFAGSKYTWCNERRILTNI